MRSIFDMNSIPRRHRICQSVACCHCDFGFASSVCVGCRLRRRELRACVWGWRSPPRATRPPPTLLSLRANCPQERSRRRWISSTCPRTSCRRWTLRKVRAPRRCRFGNGDGDVQGRWQAGRRRDSKRYRQGVGTSGGGGAGERMGGQQDGFGLEGRRIFVLESDARCYLSIQDSGEGC